ncbi:MAG: hypothetical protein IRD7MM_06000 [Candidatus Midichloria mitochondrii]
MIEIINHFSGRQVLQYLKPPKVAPESNINKIDMG